jgi:hypothetical protein
MRHRIHLGPVQQYSTSLCFLYYYLQEIVRIAILGFTIGIMRASALTIYSLKNAVHPDRLFPVEPSPLVQNEASVPHFELHNPRLFLPHSYLLRKCFCYEFVLRLKRKNIHCINGHDISMWIMRREVFYQPALWANHS